MIRQEIPISIMLLYIVNLLIALVQGLIGQAQIDAIEICQFAQSADAPDEGAALAPAFLPRRYQPIPILVACDPVARLLHILVECDHCISGSNISEGKVSKENTG